MLLSAPGNVVDFETDAQRQQWSQHLSAEIDGAIAGIKSCVPSPQYVNPANVDVSAFQKTPIHWPGFPKLVYAEFPTRREAYDAADQPSVVKGKKLSGGRLLQDEYLEWFIHRDGNGKIVSVDFTTETQEYWTFLFSQSKDLAARKYSTILGAQVQVADISDASGRYNPLNRFNTTDGIIHLIQPNNTLPAELDIAAQATRPRTDDTGQVTSDVVSCSHCGSPAGLGEPGRNSDPTIAQSVNAVAATGCVLTIPDPVGLYIQKLDTKGWTGPAGIQPSSCWNVIRGNPTVRASFVVPPGHTLDEFQIGGIAITNAGQISDKISVFLFAAFGAPHQVTLPAPAPCAGAAANLSALSFADAIMVPSRTRKRAQ